MQAAVTFAEDFDSLWPLAQICKMSMAGKVDFKDFAVLVGQWLYELCGRSSRRGAQPGLVLT